MTMAPPADKNMTLTRPAMNSMPEVDLLGLRLAAVTRDELADHVFARLNESRGGWIVTANIDHLQRHVSDPEIARMNDGADLVVADGMPLLWAARAQGTPLPDRVAGSDLVWLLAEHAAREGRSIFLLGGNPGVAEVAAEAFRERAPGLLVAGVMSPRVSMPPAADEIDSIRMELTAARPDIVYVALGAPKQEHLIDMLRADFPDVWWVGVGISLSFAAGDVKRAPVWIQKLGLEWVHRMLQEPRRLASRYLLNNLPFTLRLLARSVRRRLFYD